MAFESVVVRTLKNGVTPVDGVYRQDFVIADVILASLRDTNTGAPAVVSTYHWQLIGRPEGSVAGGAGPEPIELGNTSTATFTVDNDAGYPHDGAYVLQCTINEGSTTERKVQQMGVRLSGLTTADGRTLRMIGGFEDEFKDTSEANVRQGWAMMLNRWLRFLTAAGGGGGPATVVTGTFTNAEAVPITRGQIVRVFGDGSVKLADALVALIPEKALVGVVADVSIAAAASGNIALLGLAQVAFDAGLTLGRDPVYLSSAFAPIGRATNVPPDGDTIVPLGVVVNASTYAGVAGDKATVLLNPPPPPYISRRSVQSSVLNLGPGLATLLSIPLRIGYVYHLDATVIEGGTGAGAASGGSFRIQATCSSAGLLGAPSTQHLISSGGYLADIDVLAGSARIRTSGGSLWVATVDVSAVLVAPPA
jgi:hypothetical protein